MVANRKVTGKTWSMPMGLLAGGILSLSSTLIGAALLASMINREMVAEMGIGYGVMVILLLSSVIGSMTAYTKIRRRRMLVCALAGLVYFLTLCSITAMFFHGTYSGVLVTAAVIAGGSISVGLLGLRAGEGRKGKLHRRAYR